MNDKEKQVISDFKAIKAIFESQAYMVEAERKASEAAKQQRKSSFPDGQVAVLEKVRLFDQPKVSDNVKPLYESVQRDNGSSDRPKKDALPQRSIPIIKPKSIEIRRKGTDGSVVSLSPRVLSSIEPPKRPIPQAPETSKPPEPSVSMKASVGIEEKVLDFSPEISDDSDEEEVYRARLDSSVIDDPQQPIPQDPFPVEENSKITVEPTRSPVATSGQSSISFDDTEIIEFDLDSSFGRFHDDLKSKLSSKLKASSPSTKAIKRSKRKQARHRRKRDNVPDDVLSSLEPSEDEPSMSFDDTDDMDEDVLNRFLNKTENMTLSERSSRDRKNNLSHDFVNKPEKALKQALSANISVPIPEDGVLENRIVPFVGMVEVDPCLYDNELVPETVEMVTGIVERRIQLPLIDSFRLPYGSDASFPPGTHLFIHPTGAFLNTEKTSPFFTQFCLTVVDGSRLYGTCATMQRALEGEQLAFMKSALGLHLMENDGQEMPEKMFVPVSLFFLSPMPFHNSFLRFLSEFVLKNCKESFDSTHAHLLFNLMNRPSPITGGPSLLLKPSKTSRKPMEFALPSEGAPALHDVNMSILFKAFEPKHIITLVNTLLDETPLVLVSTKVELLFPACETLMALIYPFRWPFLYIPNLPLSLVDILQAPQPFIIGAHIGILKDCHSTDHFLTANLDNNTITLPKHHKEFVALPWRLSWKLFRKITKCMSFFEQEHPNVDLSLPDNIPMLANNDADESAVSKKSMFGTAPTISFNTVTDLFSGSDPDDATEEIAKKTPYFDPHQWIAPGEALMDRRRTTRAVRRQQNMELLPLHEFKLPVKSNFNLIPRLTSGRPKNSPLMDILQRDQAEERAIDILALRKGFLSLFVSLLAGYRDFIQLTDEELSVASKEDSFDFNIFDNEGYIAEVDSTKSDFLQKFLSTQMFDYFIQERVGKKEADWFDSTCLKKLKKEAEAFRKDASRNKIDILWKLGRNWRSWKTRIFFIEMDSPEIRWYKSTKELNKAFLKFEQAKTSSAQEGDKKIEETFRSLMQALQKNYRGSFGIREGITQVLVPESTKKSYKTSFPFEIVNPDAAIVLCASSSEERRDWIRLIKAKAKRNRQVFFKKFIPKTKAQEAALFTRKFGDTMNPLARRLNKELNDAIKTVEQESRVTPGSSRRASVKTDIQIRGKECTSTELEVSSDGME